MAFTRYCPECKADWHHEYNDDCDTCMGEVEDED